MKLIWIPFTLLLMFVWACSNETPTEETKNISDQLQDEIVEIENPEDLIERMPNDYREYYPGKKQIKIEGRLDKEQKRHGIWESYFENGTPNSTIYYVHGKKHGHVIVYHPNGTVYYVGEYEDDKQVGLWKFYNDKGELEREENF